MMLAYAILIYFCLSPRSFILTLLSQLKKMKCINKTIQRNTLIYIKENGIDTINASGFSHTHTRIHTNFRRYFFAYHIRSKFVVVLLFCLVSSFSFPTTPFQPTISCSISLTAIEPIDRTLFSNFRLYKYVLYIALCAIKNCVVL